MGAPSVLVIRGRPANMPDTNVCILFERVALASRDKVAIRSLNDDTYVTYDTLLRSAYRMAEDLLGAGLKPAQLVGVLVGRSALAITSLLGIVLAGGAYAPLDPSYPSNRLSQIIESANIHFVQVVLGSEMRSPRSVEAGDRVFGVGQRIVRSHLVDFCDGQWAGRSGSLMIPHTCSKCHLMDIRKLWTSRAFI